MNNLKTILAVFFGLVSVLLTSCTDFADTPGKSVWSEGLWILPWLTAAGAVIFGYQAYKGSRSGSRTYDQQGNITNEDAGNMPIYTFGQFWFAVGFTIATIFIIWNVVSNR